MKQFSKKTRCFLDYNSNPFIAWLPSKKVKSNHKRSRITKNTFREKSKDVFIEAKIQDHLERIIENPNPKKHTNATMEMILGRKQNEKAFIRNASWC
jgi:hypothetical protein